MIKSHQLILGLPYRKAFDREDFIVASCNQDAVTWLDLYPQWPGHALLIHGPAGCGKTHLAHIFSPHVIQAEAVTEQTWPTKNDKIVVENIDRISNEAALFHLFNWTREKGIGLLLTARKIPSFKLPDLASRMALVQQIPILAPDDELMFVVLAKAFDERGILVDAAVLEYAVRQSERTFEALHALIEQADQLSLSQNRRITIPIIKQALSQLAQHA